MLFIRFTRCGWAAGLLAASWASVLWAQLPPMASQTLVDAQFQLKQDALGFAWRIQGDGCVQGNQSRGFRMAGSLQVNNSGLGYDQTLMTPDGNEFVFTGSVAGVQLTRRVKFDLKNGTVRYLETFINSGGAPVQLNVQIQSSMASSGAIVTTDSAEDAAGGRGGGSSRSRLRTMLGPPATAPSTPSPYSPSGTPALALGAKDCGLLIAPRGDSATALLMFLASPRSPTKPHIRSESNYQFYVTYALNVPPQKSVSIVHGLAQRQPPADAKAKAKAFAAFKSKDWLRDLSPEVRGAIVNYSKGGSGDEPPAGPLLEPVLDLAEEFHVERGTVDVLVQDRETTVAGTVEGAGISVAGQFGSADIPLSDVALVMGGAGIGQTTRVFLRNGEVLAGTVDFKQASLKTESGLSVRMDAGQIHLLFFRAHPKDGQPSPGTLLLATHFGDRIAVPADSPVKLSGVTPWGPVDVPLGEVRRVLLVRDTQPLHRLILHDGCRISAILTGSELALTSGRFGAVKIAPTALAGLEAPPRKSPTPPRPPEADPSAGLADDAEGEEQTVETPYCKLAGENIILGTLDVSQLSLLTAGGATTLPIDRIRSMELTGAAAKATFDFELIDGSKLTGRLAEPTTTIRALGKVWNVPVHHLEAFRRLEEKPVGGETGPPKKPAEKPTPTSPPKLETPPSPAPAYVPGQPAPPQPLPARSDDDPFGDARGSHRFGTGERTPVILSEAKDLLMERSFASLRTTRRKADRSSSASPLEAPR